MQVKVQWCRSLQRRRSFQSFFHTSLCRVPQSSFSVVILTSEAEKVHGCMTILSVPVPDSPQKTSYRSYELNTCHYVFIRGIFLSLYAEQTEYFSYIFYSSGRMQWNNSRLTALSAQRVATESTRHQYQISMLD